MSPKLRGFVATAICLSDASYVGMNAPPMEQLFGFYRGAAPPATPPDMHATALSRPRRGNSASQLLAMERGYASQRRPTGEMG